MQVVVAPDKFRGTASATQAANAIAGRLAELGHSCIRLPMADGGEGFLEVLGGANRSTMVTGPLGDPVEAGWRMSGRTAVLEAAQASGLTLIGGSEGNDAVAASTHGTGELISAAVDAGARRVLIGVGGSATTDGGLGALRAMAPLSRLRRIQMEVACDVRTGFLAAARLFGPQKGAGPAQVELLSRRLDRLAQLYLEDFDTDVTGMEGAGAAGGLAGGLACAGAELVAGFDLVADQVELDEAIGGADLVITGEGFLDRESFDGKVVGGVADLARRAGVPVVAIVGEAFDDAAARIPTVALVEQCGRDRALGDTLACLASATDVALDLGARS